MAVEYAIHLQPRAEADIEEIYLFLREHAPDYADDWILAFEKSLQGLKTFPEKFPLAPEERFGVFDRVVRQLFHGRGFWKYRVLFFVEGTTVQIVHVRHGARRWIGETPREE